MARSWVAGLLAFGALGCSGLGTRPDGAGPDAAPTHGLEVGDPAVDLAIDAAVREQAARDALVEALKQGGPRPQAAELDAAWRATFGEPPPTGGRR